MCTTAHHEALKLDDAAWSALEQIGVQQTYDDEPGAPTHLQLANCTECHSTLARYLTLDFMDEEPTRPCPRGLNHQFDTSDEEPTREYAL